MVVGTSTARPGVAVDVPGTAQVVLAVEDDEVLNAQPLELDGGAYPPETGAHDDGVELLRSHGQTVPQVPRTFSGGLSP